MQGEAKAGALDQDPSDSALSLLTDTTEATLTVIAHRTSLTLQERRARGKQQRSQVAPDGHAGWTPATDRPDPVALLVQQEATREADLVPVRHGRMMASPFTFYRGAAKIMAADLSVTPSAGLTVQLCGDAHLLNFGGFASPERTLLFDLNDFDETLPGPFEWDVKRLAASFTIAARNNGYRKADVRAITTAAVAAYRQAMAEFATMRVLDIWYSRLSAEDLVDLAREGEARTKKRTAGRLASNTEKLVAKGRNRGHLQALSKLAETVDGVSRIVSQPPIVVPARMMGSIYGSAERITQVIDDQLLAYRETLADDRRLLLDQFTLVDVARKVVGVGSVGTRAFIALLQGRDDQDPLFLQVKEAAPSVLEDYLPKSRYANSGERVVRGQRLMQAASDIFLGWTLGAEVDRHYYWRQLRDMKVSADTESMVPEGMRLYAGACGWTLARAHSRSGDPVAIASYLGKSDKFDRSIADFSQRYADQNERDYDRFCRAVHAGELAAVEGV